MSMVPPKPFDIAIKEKACSAVVLSSSFYALQILSQRFFWTIKVHAGLPKVVGNSVGLIATVSNLCLCQLLELAIRQETKNYGLGFHSKQRMAKLPMFTNGFSSEVVKDQVIRLLLGVGIFAILEQSSFRTALPSSVIAPGVYSNSINMMRRSVRATSEATTEAQRRLIQVIGRRHGCHQCGSRQLFSRKRFIGDHMPPTKMAKEMSASFWRKFFKMPVRPQRNLSSTYYGSYLIDVLVVCRWNNDCGHNVKPASECKEKLFEQERIDWSFTSSLGYII